MCLSGFLWTAVWLLQRLMQMLFLDTHLLRTMGKQTSFLTPPIPAQLESNPVLVSRCLVDAKLTGSTSRFLPRVQADKLQFQLEAFVFQQQSSGLVSKTACFVICCSFLWAYGFCFCADLPDMLLEGYTHFCFCSH